MTSRDQSTQKYKAVIIGSGQGGKPLALEFARSGWKTALVERKFIGGTCINYGCTPTKTMIASARVAHLTRRAGDYGVDINPPTIDMKKVRRRKRDIVELFRSSGEKQVDQTEGLDLYRGHASFVSSDTIKVALNDGGSVELWAESIIIINTGCRPLIPPVDGLDEVAYLDNASIMELDEVPGHLLILGGGYVGVEFAQMFRRFGAEVTIIQMGEQLLLQEDRDVAEGVQEILSDDGIDIRLNSKATSVHPSDAGIELTLATGNGEDKITGSHLLVAAGRRPNTDDLNLEAAGVRSDRRGFIVSDERLQTDTENIYVIGDVRGGPMFTHTSYDDMRILRSNLLRSGNRSVNDRLVPYVVFIDPQLGRVGLSENQAREAGKNIKIAKMAMNHSARALETDETRGFMKVVLDAQNGHILGATVLGFQGGEIMAILQVAMMGQLPYTAIRDAVFAHPTLAESLNNLFAKVSS
jgi:pyruvate/2-oxoglutarate dehydrogenase complex dihydrolipoamide dehydrogenase (E3) component